MYSTYATHPRVTFSRPPNAPSNQSDVPPCCLMTEGVKLIKVSGTLTGAKVEVIKTEEAQRFQRLRFLLC